MTHSINIVSCICSSETDDFSVSVLSRRVLRMSSPAFSSLPSSDEQWYPSTEPWHVLTRNPVVFIGPRDRVYRKVRAVEGWLQQTWTAQEEAIEWFVTKFPPSIQEHVRTFLKTPSASYLAELEIQIHRPPINQSLYRRDRCARSRWKLYVQD